MTNYYSHYTKLCLLKSDQIAYNSLTEAMSTTIRQGVWLKVAPLLILLSAAFHETDLYLSFIFVSTIMIKGKGCWVPKMNSSYCLSFVWSSDYIDSIHRKSDWSYLFGHLEVGFWFNFQFFFFSHFSFPWTLF